MLRDKGRKSYLRLLGLALLLVAGSMTAGASTTVTWSMQSVISSSASTVALGELIYGGGLYVATGWVNGLATIMTSPDGMTWSTAFTDTTAITAGTPIYAPVEVDSVAYGGGVYVAVGDTQFLQSNAINGSYLMSTDGENWTVVANGSYAAPASNVVFGNGMFVVFTQYCQATNLCSSMYTLTSTDGVHWTTLSPQNFPQPATNGLGASEFGGRLLGFINGQFVVLVGGDGTPGSPGTLVYTSSDAVNWTLSAGFGSGATFTALHPTGNGIAAVGYAYVSGGLVNPAIATSSDGINWTQTILETGDLSKGVIHDIAQIGNYSLAAVGMADNTQQLAMSTDGLNWCEVQGYLATVPHPAFELGPFSRVVVNGGQIVTLTSDGTVVLTPPSSNTDVTFSCLDAESSGPVSGNVSPSSGGSGGTTQGGGTSSGSGGGTTPNPGSGGTSPTTGSGGGGGESLLALAGLLALGRGRLRRSQKVTC